MKAQLAFHIKNLKCKHMLVPEERHYPCISIRNPNWGITVLHVQSWKVGVFAAQHPRTCVARVSCPNSYERPEWVAVCPCCHASYVLVRVDNSDALWQNGMSVILRKLPPPPRSHPRVPLTPIVPATTGSVSSLSPVSVALSSYLRSLS